MRGGRRGRGCTITVSYHIVTIVLHTFFDVGIQSIVLACAIDSLQLNSEWLSKR